MYSLQQTFQRFWLTIHQLHKDNHPKNTPRMSIAFRSLAVVLPAQMSLDHTSVPNVQHVIAQSIVLTEVIRLTEFRISPLARRPPAMTNLLFIMVAAKPNLLSNVLTTVHFLSPGL